VAEKLLPEFRQQQRALNFGLDKTLGTIEQGKIADLVLLNANRWRTFATRKESARSFRTGAYLIERLWTSCSPTPKARLTAR
jgi:cytosine/adenosine deaminase-related metal-dependent hydrolase